MSSKHGYYTPTNNRQPQRFLSFTLWSSKNVYLLIDWFFAHQVTMIQVFKTNITLCTLQTRGWFQISEQLRNLPFLQLKTYSLQTGINRRLLWLTCLLMHCITTQDKQTCIGMPAWRDRSDGQAGMRCKHTRAIKWRENKEKKKMQGHAGYD